MDLNAAATALRRGGLHDPAGRLKAGGRRELTHALVQTSRLGMTARVVVLPRGADLGPARALWDELKLENGRDLLLLANGQRWEARGWGLTKAEVSEALGAAAPHLKRYLAAGLVRALENLNMAARRGAAAAGATTRDPKPVAPNGERSSLVGTGLVVGGGAVLLAGLAWVVARRQRRGRGVRATYDERFQAAERTYADLMVEGDALDDGDDIIRDAARLKGELDTIDGKARGDLRAMGDPVTLGRLDQVGNHLAALRTRLIQRGG